MSGEQVDIAQANETCVGPQSEQAGKASACEGCPNARLCASGAGRGEDPDLAPIQQRMSSIRKKILVLSGKGGVGKSTLTKELGMTLGRLGLMVGIMDADICGPSMPRLTGTRDEEVHKSNDGWQPVAVDDNVSLMSIQPLLPGKNDAVVFRGPRKNGVIKNFLKDVSWGDLDVLLVDTPPGTTDEHLSLVSYLKQCGGCDGAVVVTTPQEVAAADVRRELNFCKKTSIQVLGIVENMSGFVCPSCKGESQIFPADKSFKLSAGERLVWMTSGAHRCTARNLLTQTHTTMQAEEFSVPFLGKVPLDPSLMMSCEQGESLADHLEANAKEAGQSAPQPSKTLDALGVCSRTHHPPSVPLRFLHTSRLELQSLATNLLKLVDLDPNSMEIDA